MNSAFGGMTMPGATAWAVRMPSRASTRMGRM
ncbi:Uncharacterised protein [Bordetella pertussis]|nr:Uncharacterised protein [Bordetella pertussis]